MDNIYRLRVISSELAKAAVMAGIIRQSDVGWWTSVFSPFVVTASEIIENNLAKEAACCMPARRLRDIVSLVKPVLHDPVYVIPNKGRDHSNRKACFYSSLVSQNPIEKLLWNIFSYSDGYVSLRYASDLESPVPDLDSNARNELKKIVSDEFHIYVDLMPTTLYEGGLEYRRKGYAFMGGDIHEISPRVLTDEKYIFFLSTIQEQGTLLLGMPHGGVYCQREKPSLNEKAERICANLFSEPSWKLRNL